MIEGVLLVESKARSNKVYIDVVFKVYLAASKRSWVPALPYPDSHCDFRALWHMGTSWHAQSSGVIEGARMQTRALHTGIN